MKNFHIMITHKFVEVGFGCGDVLLNLVVENEFDFFGSFEVPGTSGGSARLKARYVAVAENRSVAGMRQGAVSTEKEAVRREAAREGT